MTDGPIDDLPSHVADLLALEKDAYPDALEMKQAVFARVERAVVLGAPISAGSHAGQHLGSTGASGLAKVGAAAKGVSLAKVVAIGIAMFATGGVVGGMVVRQVAPVEAPQHAPSVVAPVASAPVSHDVPSVLSTPATTKLPESNPASTAIASTHAASSSSSSSPPLASESSEDLSREREMLDVARAALARNRPEDAVVAAKKHAERWPHGALQEEREVVYIQALIAAGRRDEAEQRAAHFRRNFPHSMFAPAVAAALQPSGSPP